MSCWPSAASFQKPRLTQVLFRSPLLISPLLRPSILRLPHLSSPSVRSASQWGPRYQRPKNQRPPPRYNQFQRARATKELWQNSAGFRYGVGAGGLGFSVFVYQNLERVPVSNRLRFNCITHAYEEKQGQGALKHVLQEYQGKLLPPDHPDSKLVTKVLQRLIPASGLTDVNWEIFVIDGPEEANAFVLPGGKVFVFSGILPICSGEDGLAAILGHEIAHNFAHHLAETMSWRFPVIGVSALIAYYFDASAQISYQIADIVLSKPNSRTQESEADFIGLLMMAQACYNPKAAVGLWERMAKAEQNAPLQFLSTHPASKTRITQIQAWLPEAQAKRSMSNCGNTAAFADQFEKVTAQYKDDDFW